MIELTLMDKTIKYAFSRVNILTIKKTIFKEKKVTR